LQAAYEEFGCNDGNVFFMGIDKGNTNADVIYFDSTYGIQYPGISGQDGGGNEVHLLYEVQATPSLVIIQPDKTIAVKQVFPPSFDNVVDSVSVAGGVQQACLTALNETIKEDEFTIGPNPVRDLAYLHFNLEFDAEIEVQIYNITGQMVMEFEPKTYTSGKFYLKADFTQQQEGFYFVQLLQNKQIVATKKLVVTR